MLSERQKRKRGLAQSESESASEERNEVTENTPFAGAKPGTPEDDSETFSQDGSEDSNFIVEDDASVAIPELPVEFRQQQDLSHHFKTICQLFVHLAVRPLHKRSAFMAQSLKGVCLRLFYPNCSFDASLLS